MDIRSQYWLEYWECIERKTGEPKVQCKHCSKVRAHPRRNKQSTTTGMKTHLKECDKYKQTTGEQPRESNDIRSFYAGDNGTESTKSRITQEFVDETILKFFVSNNIPFKAADNEYFRKLISLIPLNNSTKMAHSPSRNTLCAWLSKYSKMGIDQLKHILAENDSKFSIALDCWSSRSNYGFMGISQFIR